MKTAASILRELEAICDSDLEPEALREAIYYILNSQTTRDAAQFGDSLSRLWEAMNDNPDFAGGTYWSRTDVAFALYREEDDDDPSDFVPTDEQLDSITPAQLRQARDATDNYIFSSGYSWMEAMKDAIDFRAALDARKEETQS